MEINNNNNNNNNDNTDNKEEKVYEDNLPTYEQANEEIPVLTREELFQTIMLKYEIGSDYANRLQLLSSFKVVFIFDDSSSMNRELNDSPLIRPGENRKVTRWNELEHFAKISIELVNILDPNGCDVYFLNKSQPIRNIKNSDEFLNYFKQIRANGYTPMVRTFNQILSDYSVMIRDEKKLLIIIVTDGEPTDERGNSDVNGFKKCLKNRRPMERIFVNIIACTDEKDSMHYMNKWDKEIHNLDVIDDYRSEKKEIYKIKYKLAKQKNKDFQFTYGDYVVKAIIGALDKEIDKKDEGTAKSCTIS